MRGRFITFEGGEGAGKSTHIRLLAAHLQERGIEVVMTREPGGTLLGEAVRNLLQHDAAGEAPLPRAEVLLFCASRAQLVAAVIEPALARGAWVLCDRFEDSTLAYQGAGRGWAVDELRRLSRFATGGLVPDLTVLLDLPPEAGLCRVNDRGAGQDRFEKEELAFHCRLRQGFLDLAAGEPQRFRVVNVDRETDVVAADIRKVTDDVCGCGQ